MTRQSAPAIAERAGSAARRAALVPALAEPATALAAALLAFVLLVPVLELWRASLGIPFFYSADATYTLMLVKGILEHGSWYVNPDLAAPFGQHLHDFAVGGDDLDLLLLRLLGVFSRNPATVVNVFYLLSFPASALTGYVVLRWARLGRATALACAVLFALAPYPFVRGEKHLFLAADYGVPLACYLVLALWAGRPLYRRRADVPGWRSFLTGRTCATVAACAVVASAGQVYYAGFTIVLAAIATVVRTVARPDRATLAGGLAVVVLVLGFTAANLAPSLLFVHRHGRNGAVALRQPNESVSGALSLADLLLPVPGHRLAPFARLTRFYEASTGGSTSSLEQPALGAVASVGLLWLLVVVGTSLVGVRRFGAGAADARPAAAAAASALLVGTAGGLSALIAYLATPELRGWNRLSIFIAFFSLLGVGLLLERLRTALGRFRLRRLVFAGALAAVAAIGVLDQTTVGDVPQYATVAHRWAADASFVRTVERRLPGGAMVFELPYVPYPEGYPPGATSPYDLGRPYLHSRDLRWSYGAMKGRPEDWSVFAVEKPLAELVPGVAAAGFAGLWVDRAGYGRIALPLELELRRLIGLRPLVGADGRYAFFDLRRYAVRLRARYGAAEVAALREATLTPPRAVGGAGFSPELSISGTGHRSIWAVRPQATLDLYEPGPTQWATFYATLVRASAVRPPTATIVWSGGRRSRVRVLSRGTPIAHRLLLRHGHNLVALSVAAPPILAPWDARTLYLGVVDARFSEQAFSPFHVRPGEAPVGATPPFVANA